MDSWKGQYHVMDIFVGGLKKLNMESLFGCCWLLEILYCLLLGCFRILYLLFCCLYESSRPYSPSTSSFRPVICHAWFILGHDRPQVFPYQGIQPACKLFKGTPNQDYTGVVMFWDDPGYQAKQLATIDYICPYNFFKYFMFRELHAYLWICHC